MTETPRILIVEDDALIGIMLADMFEALELSEPAHAASLVEALEMLEQERFSGALIDVHLGGEKGWPIADEFASRGIPFAFTTGGGTDIPERFRGAPVVMKPFRLNDIEQIAEHFK